MASGQEGQAGFHGAGAEDVLHVERGEQEGSEEHGRGGQHHHEAAADAAIGEALDLQQRLGRVHLDQGEGDQTEDAGPADSEGLQRGPAGAGRL